MLSKDELKNELVATHVRTMDDVYAVATLSGRVSPQVLMMGRAASFDWDQIRNLLHCYGLFWLVDAFKKVMAGTVSKDELLEKYLVAARQARDDHPELL